MLTRAFLQILWKGSFSDCFALGGGIALVLAISGVHPYGPFILLGLVVIDAIYFVVSTLHKFLYPILVTGPRERQQKQAAAEQARLAAEEAARLEELAKEKAARLEAEQIAAYERLFLEDDEDADSPFVEIEERRRESRAG